VMMIVGARTRVLGALHAVDLSPDREARPAGGMIHAGEIHPNDARAAEALVQHQGGAVDAKTREIVVEEVGVAILVIDTAEQA